MQILRKKNKEILFSESAEFYFSGRHEKCLFFFFMHCYSSANVFRMKRKSYIDDNIQGISRCVQKNYKYLKNPVHLDN